MTSILLTLIPEVASVIQAIVNLRKKYPTLTADQITTLIIEITGQSDNAFDDILSKVGANKA